MSRFTVIHTSTRGVEIRLDYDDLELATAEAEPRSRGYEKTEVVLNENGKVIPLAEAEEMLLDHEMDIMDSFHHMAELDDRTAPDADAQWDFMMQEERRGSLARLYHNDPGAFILAERELEDEESQTAMRFGL